jgi:hypothetical protein
MFNHKAPAFTEPQIVTKQTPTIVRCLHLLNHAENTHSGWQVANEWGSAFRSLVQIPFVASIERAIESNSGHQSDSFRDFITLE